MLNKLIEYIVISVKIKLYHGRTSAECKINIKSASKMKGHIWYEFLEKSSFLVADLKLWLRGSLQNIVFGKRILWKQTEIQRRVLLDGLIAHFEEQIH